MLYMYIVLWLTNELVLFYHKAMIGKVLTHTYEQKINTRWDTRWGYKTYIFVLTWDQISTPMGHTTGTRWELFKKFPHGCMETNLISYRGKNHYKILFYLKWVLTDSKTKDNLEVNIFSISHYTYSIKYFYCMAKFSFFQFS